MTYSRDEKALIFLSSLEFMTSAKFERVLSHFNEPSEIFDADAKKLFELKDILKNHYEEFLNALVNFDEKEFFNNLARRGVHCLTIISQNYPKRFLNLKNPPYVLYYCGNIDLLNEKAVAVVGTRNPSAYGKTITEKFSRKLAEKGLTIVSGLASGVDKIAHENALDVGGNTIAVLGGGFDHMFPAMNVNLAREIAKRGLILTEYYLTVKPTKYTFPVRNRIIACVSDGVLITEAKLGSGSLYTKDYADDLNINTYAIPGNVTSEKSDATNELIRSSSAVCVCRPEDILKDFGFEVEQKTKNDRKSKETNLNLSDDEKLIYDALKDGEKDFDYLIENTSLSVKTLNYNLTTMEIRGIIRKLAGNIYILIA